MVKVKKEEVELVNLTPHEITIVGEDGEVRQRIPPSGLIARVAVKQEKVGEVGGIPMVKSVFGDVVLVKDGKELPWYENFLITSKCDNCRDAGLCDLPARTHDLSVCKWQQPIKYYIVSSIVAQALSKENRNDVISPDTSPEGVVRDSEGRIIGVKRFQRW